MSALSYSYWNNCREGSTLKEFLSSPCTRVHFDKIYLKKDSPAHQIFFCGIMILFTNFRLVWPCIMNVGWRERNQQDATIKLLSQHVSGIIMPIIRRIRVYNAAYGFLHWLWWLWLCGAGTQVHTARVPAPHNHSYHNQCRTTYAAVHTLVLLMMGIMMPEICWDKSLIINIGLVASCWFYLHCIFLVYVTMSLSIVTSLYLFL